MTLLEVALHEVAANMRTVLGVASAVVIVAAVASMRRWW